MAQEKLTILHILGDYKFYLSVSAIFDQSKYYNNVYVYKTRNKKNIECQKIEERAEDVIISEHYHEILNIIQTRNIDIVYFHGLAVSRWKFVSEIPKSKIIIWWAWGFDLYENYDINRVWASRSVNANGNKRGKLTEILVRNYTSANCTQTNISNNNHQLRLAL